MLGLILGLIAVWMWFVLVFTDGEDATISAWFLAPILVPLAMLIGALHRLLENLKEMLIDIADVTSGFERSVYKKG